MKLIKKTSRRDNMKFLEESVLLTHEEYNKYLRMEACIEELQSTKKTDFIQPNAEEVEA